MAVIDDLDAFFKAHAAPDTDQERNSMHHTLGPSPLQAAPGNHNHDKAYVSPTQLDAHAGVAGAYGSCSMNADQSIPNDATYHTIIFQVPSTDIKNWSYDNATGIWTCGPAGAGRYDVSLSYAYRNPANPTGLRYFRIFRNATVLTRRQPRSDATESFYSHQVNFAAGDTLKVDTQQTDTAALNLNSTVMALSFSRVSAS